MEIRDYATDQGKLRALADWLDLLQNQGKLPGPSREIQEDLRRIADRIEGLDANQDAKRRTELDQEMETYRRNLDDILGDANANEGRFVVIYGVSVFGIYPTRDAALKHAYETFGLVPFLVKKIERNPQPIFL